MSVTFTEIKKAVEEIEPCTVREVCAQLNLNYNHRTTVRNRLNQLVDSGILAIVDKRPARFAINHMQES